MKMTDEGYSLIVKGMQELVEEFGIDEIKNFRYQVKFSKDQFTSFIWAMYYKIKKEYKDKIREEQLSDSHIETALKKYFKEFHSDIETKNKD